MANAIDNAPTMQFELGYTAKVLQCEDGGYAGAIQELPIVAQADSIEELRDRLSGCLMACAKHGIYGPAPSQ